MFIYSIFLRFSKTHDYYEGIYDVPINIHGKMRFISKEESEFRTLCWEITFFGFSGVMTMGCILQFVFGKKVFPPLGYKSGKMPPTKEDER